MKLLRKIALALLALVALFVVVGLVLPRRWHVERSVVIHAPPEQIFPLIASPMKWQEWSVWTRAMDPLVKYSYAGVDEGAGAEWSWIGPKMGRGKMRIVASDPKTGVQIDEAIESEQVNAHASFSFSPDGAGTRVVWLDEGTLPPVMGGYFRGMIEKMLGENFEAGLRKLKGVVEAQPPMAVPVVPPPAEPPDAG